MESSHSPVSSAALGKLPLAEFLRRARRARGGGLNLREWIALAEAWRIAQALRESRGNRSAAARALGIGRRTLYTKMDKLGLVPSRGLANGPLDAAASESRNDGSKSG